jgi:DNA-directed RNA polymerase subunit RPC12/RpoP
MEYYNGKEFQTRKEMFDFIVKNRVDIIAQKKAVKKTVDCGIIVHPTLVRENNIQQNKALSDDPKFDVENLKQLRAVVLINTTNFFDKHRDVHIPGLWDKTLRENKFIMHVQEHDSSEFEMIISSGKDLKAYVKTYTWAELGYPYEGTTEGLTFDSLIRKERNEFMLKQYAYGWVVNHSVGMRYIKMDYAFNDESYPNEYEAWKKYYPQIANKEEVDEVGMFCYVLEAKCIEGSAVPMGSNSATPTISTEITNVKCSNCNTEFDYNSVPEKGMGYVECPNCKATITQGMISQPPKGTHKQIEPPIQALKTINYKFLFNNLKL